MKLIKIILVLFVIGMVTHSKGQVIYNGSFEENCSTAYSPGHPFDASCSGTSCSAWPTCVPGWRSSHGSPNTSGIAYSGSVGVEMWSAYSSDSSRVLGEGIFTDVCFTHNATYLISLWVKTTGPAATLNIYAASGTPANGSLTGGQRIPTITGEILYQNSLSASSWTSILIRYTPNSSVPIRNQLVIYPYQSGSIYSYVYVDNISVIKSTCCSNTYVYQNTNTITNTNVNDNIRIGNNVGSIYDATGDVDFASGGDAVLKAGNYISLETGFTAEYGSNLQALISSCTSAGNCNYNSTCADNLRIGYSDFSDIMISDNNMEKIKDIKLYPSPTNGKLFIDFVPAKKVMVTVSNLIGASLFRSEYNDILYETKEIDLSKLPDGIYIISINRDGIIKTETVTVVK
jgi:hypothetical protein